jgi:hypothetical protein
VSLKEQMAMDAAIFFNENDFAVSARYIPKGAESGEIIVVNFRQGATVVDGQLIALESAAEALLQRSDVASPTPGDVLVSQVKDGQGDTVDGEIWRLPADAVLGADNICWRVRLEKDAVPLFGRGRT